MTTAAQILADFAVGLHYDEIPAAVTDAAKDCFIDAVAVCASLSTLGSNKTIVDYATRYGKGGNSVILGTPYQVHAPHAAFANGAIGASFEMDSVFHPGVGAHPGASLTAPGLAIAHEMNSGGKEFITAFVAGAEVQHRIASASPPHSSEELGFHAPGLTGVFAGTVMAGRLLSLDVEQMTQALGIAGSLCAGLLEFSQSGGGMVKRMHIGRAAEAGVLAAMLARTGFTGPATVLEGKYGYLNVFCRQADAARLTAGLGEEWRTLKIVLKPYPCHSTALLPVTAAVALKTRHGISGKDIESVTVSGIEKIVSHNTIHEPRDVTTAQYSTPFCVALAFYRDPRDPKAYTEASLHDPDIRALCRNVRTEVRKEGSSKSHSAALVTARLKNGLQVSYDAEYFPGMLQQPLSRAELQEKFEVLTAASPEGAGELFARLVKVEAIDNLRELWRVQ